LPLTIETPTPFSLEQTVLLHGWVWLAPYAWDEARQALQRWEELPSGRVVRLTITQPKASRVAVAVEPPTPLTPEDRQAIVQRVRRALALDLDLSEFIAVAKREHPGVWRLLRAGGGRLLRGFTLYEDLVKTLCTTNAAWAYTEKMVASFCRLFGRPVPSGDGWTFPRAEAVQQSLAGTIAESPARRLHGDVPSLAHPAAGVLGKGQALVRRREVPQGFGYRIKYLSGVTDRVVLDGIAPTLEHPNVVAGRKTEWLAELPGFGPYAVNHMLVLLHHFDQLPVDREVLAYLGVAGKSAAVQQRRVEAYRQRWGRWAFLGYKLERQVAKKNWTGR